MEYTVYVHKNLKNEKYYVGMTSKEPKERWRYGRGYQNQPKMWKDIQESDWNKDWVHGILGKFENEQDALKYESFLIAMLGSIENGYNTSSYGSAHSHTEESKNKISDSMTGENNPMFGKHFTEEHRKKLSKAHTGKHLSEETKNKISKSMGINGILQFSKSGEFIAEYPSTREAERQTGCHQGHICKCCKGKLKSCGGYIWRYKD